MKHKQQASSTFTGLITIVCIYVFLIILILVFADQMLTDVSEGRILPNLIVITLGIVFPLLLVGTLIYNIVKIIREKRSGKPGIKFKIRLILFFSFIAILSTVPQGILSINFIKATMNSWFSSSFEKALNGGLHIALEYYNDTINNLDNFNESNIFSNILADIPRSESRLWENLKGVNPAIDSIQVFTESGSSVLFKGDPKAILKDPLPQDKGEGILPKEDYYDLSILRTLKYIKLDGVRYSVILSIILPANFNKEAKHLTDAIETFTLYKKFYIVFSSALIFFYMIFSFPLLLLSLLISFLLSEEIIRPIVNLEDATKRVADGDFSFRILSRSGDELSILVNSFNKMVSELERSRVKIRQTEKITAWQEIAQRMAHEIKNPLTPIKLSAQRILKNYQKSPPELDKVLKPAILAIIKEVDNLNHLLKEFTNFARLPHSNPVSIDLKTLLNEVLTMYSGSYPNISIHTENIKDNLIIPADKDQIKQVFSNLFKNAIESIDDNGSIFVYTDLVTKGNYQYCRIQIQDTGSGIEEEYHNKVFNPYFTTKEDGTGLGLPIVERIIFDHKGQIWFETQKGVGTTFFIDLPTEK